MRQLKAFIKQIPGAERAIWHMRKFLPNAPVHGMTSRQEQRYFKGYGRDIYTGKGEIVDLGCWLGSTTVPLARGLEENPRAEGRRIHAYDLFVWEEWMNPFMGGCAREYHPGELFLNEFLHRTQAFSHRIEVRAGDLQAIGWSGQPIEFLLVDAMKTWGLAKCIVEQFYTKLLPETGVLLHQDFKHYYTSWIHLIQYRLRDHFVFEDDIPNSGSAVFRMVKPIEGDLNWLSDLKSFSDAEVNGAFEYSMSLVRQKESSSNIAAAKVMHFIHLDRIGEARDALAGFLRAGLPVESDLGICQRMLAAK